MSDRSHRARFRLETLERREVMHTAGGAGGLLQAGHYDIFEAHLEEEGASTVLELKVHNHEDETDFAPEGTVFLVKDAAKQTRPAGDEFNFLGTPIGSPVWVLPQSQRADLLYLGVAAEDIPAGDLGEYFENDPRVNATGEYVRIDVTGFDGPGEMSIWANDAFGEPVVYVQTSDGVGTKFSAADALFVRAGAHDHYNFGFSAPGEYKVRVKASAYLGDGKNLPISTSEEEYTFYVQTNPNDLPILPPEPTIAVAPDAGVAPRVTVYDAESGEQKSTFFAYDASFTGGVRVATGDVNGDGVNDTVTIPGVGLAPLVKVFDGKTNAVIASYFAYEEAFRGGSYVSLGDLNADGKLDLFTGTGVGGGPRVRVLDALTGTELANFFAYESTFAGGVYTSAGDINGDGYSDILTGTGPGGGPRVQVFDGKALAQTGQLQTLANFFAFDSGFRGGVVVSTGDVNGDGTEDAIVGTGPGGGPRVQTFDGKQLLAGKSVELSNFFAFDGGFRAGVRVSATDSNGDGYDDIVAAQGRGGDPVVKVFSGKDGSELKTLTPFESAVKSGLFVG